MDVQPRLLHAARQEGATLTRRGLLVVLAVAFLALAAAAAWSAYQAVLVQRDLRVAETALRDLRSGLADRDPATVEDATRRLRAAAGSAADRTDGPTWAVAARLPVLGDDARGVRALATSARVLADDGVAPLAAAVEDFDHVTVDRRVDLRLVARLTPTVAEAAAAFDAAAAVADHDSSGYAGPLRERFDRYVEVVAEADRALAAAREALDLLPSMVGAAGERDYLLVFQNNAEIRAGGGLAGSWAWVHADDGLLTIERQGAGGDFGERSAPVLALTGAEQALYGPQLGTYFRDATATPDFPRSATLLAARWEEELGEEGPRGGLDGVVAVDVVALSYLLDGIGHVSVRGATLTDDNLVETLLRTVYAELPPARQDAAFEDAARAVFEAAKGELASSYRFAAGLHRAVAEDRLHLVSFRPDEAARLAGSRLEGALGGTDPAVPRLDVDLHDATGSKMSAYLEYRPEVRVVGCDDRVQTLDGELTLHQTLFPAAARRLPDYVTGGGRYGVPPGQQLLVVRLHGPAGGELTGLEVAGEPVGDAARVVPVAGRPTVNLVVQLVDEQPVVVRWRARTALGADGDVAVGLTPSVVPGSQDLTVPSGCGRG